ncbi:DUF4175 domain-containing protein [Thalassospira lucentensis]|uniref:DUF4175 domain-containing protein n=1 Tax=Thalassospira lucentensis TaxID=168935 RepID=UPI00142DFC28|nr:DUF4175 family protein [Thalassospira lucentensis]NIZ00319.1 DUF4175 domain-containing protein [Thalassospira lucentensis]
MSLIPPYPEMETHVRRTRMVLLWESVWPRVMAPLGLVILTVGLTLTGTFELLPPSGHIILLSVLAVAMLVALLMPWRHFHWPTRRDILHRLEYENGLANNPLQSLEDQISKTEDPFTVYLWQKQIGLHEAAIAKLRLPRPIPAISRIDRFGVVVLPVLVLFVGIMVGHNAVSERFSKAFSPLQRLGTADFSATLWVTPPPYTGQVPRVLQISKTGADTASLSGQRPSSAAQTTSADAATRDTDADANANNDVINVEVPAGSTLDGTISSIWEPTLTAPDGERVITDSGNNSYVLSTAINQPGMWRISVWGTDRTTLNINLVADKVPTARFVSPPTVTRRDHLRFDYVANDDYGMTQLDLVITPAPENGVLDPFGPIDAITINLKGEDSGRANAGGSTGTNANTDTNSDTARTPTRIEGPRFVDLVAHPWAGLPVNIQMHARDNAGQTALSDMRSLVLPEREFTHPVAQKLIAIRRALLRHPDRAHEMQQALLPVLYAPQAYNSHIGVFLTLSVAESRLAANLEDRAVHQDVAGLLWHIAEEIERGSYGIAERNLMEAEEALLEALSDPDVTEAEIAQLIENYRKALNEYLAALTRDAAPAAEDQQQATATIEQQDLSRIIDQIDALMRAGARDDARQLIERLRELVENMQVTTGEGGMDITSALREMLDGMRDLSRRQQNLMNEGDNNATGNGPGQRAEEQQGLANDAGDIINNPDIGQFGEASGMNSVIDAMRRAAEALGHNRSHEALQYQRQAMENLKKGIGEINRALEGLSQLAPLLEDLEGAGRRDPLGRPVGGDGTTTIPNVDTLERAWRIMQELRRRSGDPDRPQIEQDYIDRLLKRF